MSHRKKWVWKRAFKITRSLNKFCSWLRNIQGTFCLILFRIISISWKTLFHSLAWIITLLPTKVWSGRCHELSWPYDDPSQCHPMRGQEADNTGLSQPIRDQHWQHLTNDRPAGPAHTWHQTGCPALYGPRCSQISESSVRPRLACWAEMRWVHHGH